MIDTIKASTPYYLKPSDKTIDWEADITDKGIGFIKKSVLLPNGATIFIRYYLTHSLTISFSASRIQNGDNAVAYNFQKFYIVKDTIFKVLKDEVGITELKLSDFKISRLDLNRDFVYDDEKTAAKVEEFLNKILPFGYEKRENYDTGFTSQTKKGRGFRAYRKDKDKNKKKRRGMKPTVRLEYQMDKKQAKKMFGYRPNLNEILTKQVTIEKLWNRLLRIYALDKTILNRNKLDTLSKNELTITEQKTLKQMNDEPSFDDKNQRCWQLKVIRKLKAKGTCPYSCEVPILLKVNVCSTILNLQRKKNAECTLCKQHLLTTVITLRDTNKKFKKWYLDSS